MADHLQELSQFGSRLLPDVVWSWSKLDTYETCPKRFAALNIYKSHQEATEGKRSEALEYGDLLHKEMEQYVKMRRPVSPAHTALARVVDKVVAGARSVMSELKVGLTRALTFTAFFNDDVACRMIIDLIVDRGDAAVVLDWKSGQPREGPTQLKLSALGGMALKPHVEQVHCAYVYSQGYPSKQEVLRREDVPELVDQLYPRIERFGNAIKADTFPARECWACRFCPVIECGFNKSRVAR